MSEEKKYRFDMRAAQIETREIRDGNRLIMQGRSNMISPDGSVEHGAWHTNGVIPNYGDVFDKKPGFLQRIFGRVL